MFAAPLLDVSYHPRALSNADAAFEYLTTRVAWLERMQARQTVSFGLPYNYSGQVYEAREMPEMIAKIAARAAELAGHEFNNCLCNRYETGEHSMGYHQDSYAGLMEKSKIAIVSLGATRTLQFRSLDQRHRKAQVLEHGSILLMSAVTQQGWKHEVTREPKAGCRISATFRWIIDAQPSRG